jgi:hypothetical protein
MSITYLAERVETRIANIMESVTILYADEREGNDQFEDDLSLRARAAGFYLVEDEDGDLIAQSVPHVPGGIWEGDDE